MNYMVETYMKEVCIELQRKYTGKTQFLLVGIGLGGYAAALLARMLSGEKTSPKNRVNAYFGLDTFTSGEDLFRATQIHATSALFWRACLLDYGFNTLKELKQAVGQDNNICVACDCDDASPVTSWEDLVSWTPAPCAASAALQKWIEERNTTSSTLQHSVHKWIANRDSSSPLRRSGQEGNEKRNASFLLQLVARYLVGVLAVLQRNPASR